MKESTSIKVGQILKEEMAVAITNLKAKGLDIAEESLLTIFHELNELTKRAVIRTPNKIDDLYLVVESQVTKVVTGAIDKVDGEEDFGQED